MNKFYITTTLPYVNAEPHLGFAMEIVQADIVARYHSLLGENVIFNTGTDEHGIKIYRATLEQGKDPQSYVDEYAAKFDALKETLNLSYTNFIRTSDPKHKKAAQEFWKRCLANGDIYKKNYKIKYCVGCELEKTDSELEDGKCPIHPNLELEIIEEENYFFKFSKYQNPLLEFYEKNPKFVIPDFRFKEIKKFVKVGLNDFSISRLKEKLPWGVPVPNDDKQVMYVWFDALINYISTLGWPEDEDNFRDFWGTKENLNAIQLAGKDNLRQQAAMWQAMLMSAGLPNSKQIIIHGFITSGGQKISKSLGNVVDPIELSKKYGTDAVRYYLAAKINPFEDSDFTIEKFEDSYNSDLANGLGNLVSRLAKLAENSGLKFPNKKINGNIYSKVQKDVIEDFRFDLALNNIWTTYISPIDIHINQETPWTRKGYQLQRVLGYEIDEIRSVAKKLKPFLPETAEKIEEQFKGPKIKSGKPLFPRI